MRRALKIVSIIFGVLLIVGSISAYIILFLYLKPTPEPNFQWMLFLIPERRIIGGILSFSLTAQCNDSLPSRTKLIALGVLAILTGAEAPGILAIIHGAKNGMNY